jgi:hypothetical protein
LIRRCRSIYTPVNRPELNQSKLQAVLIQLKTSALAAHTTTHGTSHQAMLILDKPLFCSGRRLSFPGRLGIKKT